MSVFWATDVDENEKTERILMETAKGWEWEIFIRMKVDEVYELSFVFM